jgi:hypothetical protein
MVDAGLMLFCRQVEVFNVGRQLLPQQLLQLDPVTPWGRAIRAQAIRVRVEGIRVRVEGIRVRVEGIRVQQQQQQWQQ